MLFVGSSVACICKYKENVSVLDTVTLAADKGRDWIMS